jgi:hypothetical protein
MTIALIVIIIQSVVIYNQQKRIALLVDTVRKFRYIENT